MILSIINLLIYDIIKIKAEIVCLAKLLVISQLTALTTAIQKTRCPASIYNSK